MKSEGTKYYHQSLLGRYEYKTMQVALFQHFPPRFSLVKPIRFKFCT